MSEGLLFILLLVAAPCIGSFLTVVILRLPVHQPIIVGRSACTSCHTRLGPRDLVPVLSWLFTKGRCRHCGGKVSALYPAVELAALGLVLWAATQTQGVVLIATCLLGWTLLAISIIDARTCRIPDTLNLALFSGGAVVNLSLNSEAFFAHCIGLVAGYGIFFLIGWIYKCVRQRSGLGLGDAKLMGAIGMWVAWQGLPSVLLVASTTALVTALIYCCFKRISVTSALKFPFGPFLALGAWLVWLYGPLTF